MDINNESLELHEKLKGKLSIDAKMKVGNKNDLSLLYTPGVAEACRKIVENPEDIYKYTMKGNCVAVITDGSAVLGLGNIGSRAGLPVMEGKSLLFKEFAGIDSFPICLESQDVKLNIKTIKNIAPVFGGINLEDFKAPECFEIENALQDLGIPVMHDDQHGLAIVGLAALINSAKVVRKDLKKCRIAVSGAGAASVGLLRLLIAYGIDSGNVILCDRKGAVYSGRTDLEGYKKELAEITNSNKIKGSLADAMKGADIFVGLSSSGLVNGEMVKSMAGDAIVFAMANPLPEIMPDEARKAGARIVATGRSDFPNQVNNLLAFPGVFKGALEVRATKITQKMKLAAAKALVGMVKSPNEDNILPSALDRNVTNVVAEAVKKAWMNDTKEN